MYCPNCRRLIPSIDNFCSYCGAELYPGQPAFLRWAIYAASLIAVLLVGAGILSYVFFRDSITGLATQVPIVQDLGFSNADLKETPELAATPTPAPSPTPAPTPTPTSMPTPTPTLVPTATPAPTPAPTATPLPSPTAYHTPTPPPTATAIPSPTPIPPGIYVLPDGGPPNIDVSIYGQGLPPLVPVSAVRIGGVDVTPSPRPATDAMGNLYFSFSIPALAGGQRFIEVQLGGEVIRTGFGVIAPPTPTPTATPTPAPTRVPLQLRRAGHGDAEYTVNVPVRWPGGRITFLAKPHSGTPGDWVQYNAIPTARRYDIKPLKDAGVNLVGTYFKERYNDEQLCGSRGFVVIRETALVLDFREVGIALHVNVCEADLPLLAEHGRTNEDISREIITSLRQQR